MPRTLLAGIVALALPISAYALTLTELQAQLEAALMQMAGIQAPAALQAASTPSVSCYTPTQTLARGNSGEHVRALQEWLRTNAYLQSEPTGYFGALTEEALKNFQSKRGIVTHGSPATTGWGVLGPKTRAEIVRTCSVASSPATPQATSTATKTPQCPVPPLIPIGGCAGDWKKISNAQSCHVGWSCAPLLITSNKPPVIARIDGPNDLLVSTLGTWTIQATDPEGSKLSYSVAWGDQDPVLRLQELAGAAEPLFVSQPTVTHAFVRAGTFEPEVTVRDEVGNTTSARFKVVTFASSTSILSSIDKSLAAGPNACNYAGAWYPEGTVTEGRTLNDLCLFTNGKCEPFMAYVPKFKCALGAWISATPNPYPNLPTYGGLVGNRCSSGSTNVVVEPNTQLCRGLLCATAQTYDTVPLSCSYGTWVDWGLFKQGATTTSVCADPLPCEYHFGTVGRACGPKQLGQCPAVPYQNHPLQ